MSIVEIMSIFAEDQSVFTMKQYRSILTFLGLGIITAMNACTVMSANKFTTCDPMVDTIEVVKDSVGLDSGICHAEVVLYTLKNAGKALTNSVNEWTSEVLGNSYTGDYSDSKKMITYYINETLRSLQEIVAEDTEGGLSLFRNFYISKMSEGKSYLTMSFFCDEFIGGFHGLLTLSGVTFRKSDGRRIGWDVFFTYRDGFEELMTDSLKAYFGVDTDEELRNQLLKDNEYPLVPLPRCGPLFTTKGVLFQYQSYEITSYANGMPNFILPYEQLKPYMTETARRLVFGPSAQSKNFN
ncbi:RsiV family protein [Alloprevotella tannerae]|uniref:RsiV family protein n=1 Tax=Alloprevotella tannerae TaxID=76122 RepID=UPI0028EF6653|nr:RsiV family protein [Alloprevotella tannerae]